MVVLLRSASAGMLTMLPNVFPMLVTFGLMGWIGRPVDVGAMMTASVALGIAVDDTLHFLTWFRRGLKQGQTRQQAIVEAYQRCAPAMTQTTLIAGLGLLVFALSSFQPVSQFGLLMFILLAAALVGDLVLLPAMLATGLGRFFEPRRRPGKAGLNPVARFRGGSV
jgi:predicted RND superfamily exporter protein